MRLLLLVAVFFLCPAANAAHKILFIAGEGSHGFGAHEFRAGSLLLADELRRSGLSVEAVVSEYGWPDDAAIFDGVNAVVMMCTGEEKHLLNDHLEFFDRLAAKGVGLVLIHTSTITTKGAPGDHFMKWVGGYHELFYSVVDTWEAAFDALPEHPVTRGVKPFVFGDEWYFHMRFQPGLKGVTPILSAHPKRADVMSLKSGKLKGGAEVKEAVARGESQHVAWAFERDGGGRGFGFTGAHDHWSWADVNYRKLVLNAIVWTAGAEVPQQGVPAGPLTLNQLLANQDDNPKPGTTLEDVLKAIPAPLAQSAEEPRFEPLTSLGWDADKTGPRIAFLTGLRNSAYGTLESYAGSVLLGRELEGAVPGVDVAVFARPYANDLYVQLKGVSAVVINTDEGPPNPLDKATKPLAELIDSGIGIVALTSSLVASPGKGDLILQTVGGRAEAPAMFDERRIRFAEFTDHPICRGLAPFDVVDGWLAKLQFVESDGIRPLLRDPLRNEPLLWVKEHASGQRAVGFAGGFHHFALANTNYRRCLLNALAWAAKLEISERGIATDALSLEDLQRDQSHRPPGNLDWDRLAERFGIAR